MKNLVNEVEIKSGVYAVRQGLDIKVRYGNQIYSFEFADDIKIEGDFIIAKVQHNKLEIAHLNRLNRVYTVDDCKLISENRLMAITERNRIIIFNSHMKPVYNGKYNEFVELRPSEIKKDGMKTTVAMFATDINNNSGTVYGEFNESTNTFYIRKM